MARDDGGDLPARITALAAPFAEKHEVELIEVEVRGQRGSRVVRLVADADGGLDVDRIAALSRDVEQVLDEQDLIPGRYTLEVSSPGVDRPLRRPRDFQRNVGRDVRVVRSRAAIDRGEKGEVTGTVVSADDSGVTLQVAGDEVVVGHDDIDHGKVVLPW